MAVGSYGIVRPADVSPADVEIIYHYVSGRTTDVVPVLKKLDPTTILTPVFHNTNTDPTTGKTATNVEIIGGMYNLKLQASDFSGLGISATCFSNSVIFANNGLKRYKSREHVLHTTASSDTSDKQ